jgi:FixJ family two-component response regulator
VKDFSMTSSDRREDYASEAPLVSIVDDDASVRRSTRRLLSCSALRAEAFASADEFLQSGLMGETACLLLDMSMPGINGLELQRRLSEIGCLAPVIFLSGRASGDEERRALQAGAARFLRKPVGKETLLRAIRAAIEGPEKVHERGYEQYND